jgi:hypothetical protein
MRKALLTTLLLALGFPTLLPGQAIFWSDPYAKARSSAGAGWDSGNSGTSALGQLESVAGRKVDTSSVPEANPPQPVEQAPPRVVHKPHSLSPSQQLGVSVFGAVLENVLSSSASDTTAAKAQALEQQRMAAALQRQEELRKARLLHNQWRAEWDERDKATTEQLAGVFDASASASGGANAFFGIPGGVAPKSLLPDVALFAEDASVVDLRGAKSFSVGPPAPSGRAGTLSDKPIAPAQDLRLGAANTPERVVGGEQPEEWSVAQSYARWTWDKYKAEATSQVEGHLLEAIPGYASTMSKINNLPGVAQYLRFKKYKEFYEDKLNLLSAYNERVLALVAEGSQRVVQGGSDYQSYDERVLEMSHQGQEQFREKALDEILSKVKE